jgi:hypothetical protein
MFVRLWPKKKAEVPVNDLKNLAKAFDTTSDPLLQLKGCLRVIDVGNTQPVGNPKRKV